MKAGSEKVCDEQGYCIRCHGHLVWFITYSLRLLTKVM